MQNFLLETMAEMQQLAFKEIEELADEVRQNLKDPLEFDTIEEIVSLISSIRQNYEFKLSLSKDTLDGTIYSKDFLLSLTFKLSKKKMFY